MSVELRCGKWEDVLGDIECDALICDPPYSERTHSGHSGGVREATRWERSNGARDSICERREIDYAAWSEDQISNFVRYWTARTTGWFVVMSDHLGAQLWERHLEAAGRYVFAPLPYVAAGSRVRLAGDGPSCWTCWIVVARPRAESFRKWGTLQGAYVLPSGHSERLIVPGGKPLWLMRELVRDYSRPGDIVCDPCSGGATTLIAAAMEGRRAIGAEQDPATYAKAMKRIAKGWTQPLFIDERKPATQEPLALDTLGAHQGEEGTDHG